MTGRWLILADDLTGAADCAIAFARRGLAPTVGWGADPHGAAAEAEVFSYDAGSRGMAPAEAAARHAALLGRLPLAGRRLYKKIDSTLRGQPAAETAATVAHLAARDGIAFGILAPAFPSLGRTTLDGRVRVDGRPLEESEVWRREHSYADSDLVAALAGAGLAAELVPLDLVRGSAAALAAALRDIGAGGGQVAVCDAVIDADLHCIAEAGLALPGAFFIGSAGLAHSLAAGLPEVARPTPPVRDPGKGSLIVVGSLASPSRLGARRLVAAGEAVHVPVEPGVLLAGAGGRSAVGHRVAGLLAAGEDVLVEIQAGAEADPSAGPRLAAALAETLRPAAACVGALAATGGETAAALLAGFGVGGIRLFEEVEPGIALGVTLGDLSVPVVTKAGAFGNEETLRRIAGRLRAPRRKGSPQ